MDFRTYESLRTAKIAVNAAELGREIVRYDYVNKISQSGRVRPVILCDTQDDFRRCRALGFAAELKHTCFRAGATVRLRDEVPKERPGELAVIHTFLETIDGGVVLDRAIGGTRYWNVADLVLIEPGIAG